MENFMNDDVSLFLLSFRSYVFSFSGNPSLPLSFCVSLSFLLHLRRKIYYLIVSRYAGIGRLAALCLLRMVTKFTPMVSNDFFSWLLTNFIFAIFTYYMSYVFLNLFYSSKKYNIFLFLGYCACSIFSSAHQILVFQCVCVCPRVLISEGISEIGVWSDIGYLFCIRQFIAWSGQKLDFFSRKISFPSPSNRSTMMCSGDLPKLLFLRKISFCG